MTLSTSVSFKDILIGSNPFYKQPDYLEKTQQEFSQEKALPVSYTWKSTENKVIRIVKFIFSVLIFPFYALYKYCQLLAGIMIVPSTSPSNQLKAEIIDIRMSTELKNEWKYKRFTIAVDGNSIDGVIVGKESTLDNGRWILRSGGNGEFYENTLHDHNFKEILSEVKGNAILFNYPGVAASKGLTNRKNLEKTYRAMLTFLEDKENGIGAKEIIGFGHSLGGGVQGEALKTHKLKNDIKYVFIKNKTFSNLSNTVSKIMNPIFGLFIKIFDWNLDSVESSMELNAPEIIIQTGNNNSDGPKIVTDGVIPAEASLAQAILDDPRSQKKKKMLIITDTMHNEPIPPTDLTTQIEDFLKT